jgi:Mrp family chromosome partitioning ATPase
MLEYRRGGQRQGRRRQIHGRRQPGAGLGGRPARASGILDADIYGPSQPADAGSRRAGPTPDGKHIEPLEAHGLKAMSIGFLVDADRPMVWRGPMVTQALTQLLRDTNWGELDYLVVDMPPGTGDIQLTLAQRVPVTGAVIVTTPQDIALADARKGLAMFEKVGGAGARHRREHERCTCAPLRPCRAHLRRRRRRTHGGRIRRAAAGRAAARHRASARRPTAAGRPW